jgi:hypothetical protein
MSASGGMPGIPEMPYFTTVSRLRDAPSGTDISLVTLPAGTVLFRGIQLPTENPLAFYTDYLGTPSMVGGSPTLCLKPTHNVFFYAHPLVCFGAHNVGPLFDAVQVVVLVKDVNVVCMIRPSLMVRGEGKRYSGISPIQRCSNFKEACGELTEDAIRQLSYDNCLSPDYQRRSFTRGWMAIANLDSIEPKLEDEQEELRPTMAPYLKALERRQPGVGSILTASTYVDATRSEKGKNPRTGFPEIVLYPYATPPGDKSLHQPCSSDIQAMALIAKHAKKDNLLYLPIVTITAKGVVDMIGGSFSVDRVSPGGAQTAVENNLTKYLNTAMRYGVRLPFYGNGAISFDMRTGFYILPQVATASYRENILPMDSNKAPATRKMQHDSMRKYLVTARTYSEETYKKEIVLPTGPVVNRFIFARPILLAPIFKTIGISLPRDMYEYLNELSAAYKASRGPLRITAPVVREGRTPLGTPVRTPNFILKEGSTTPKFGFESTTPKFGPESTTPKFGPESTTPKFGPESTTPTYGPATPTYGAATPTYGAATPLGGTPLGGTPTSPKYIPSSLTPTPNLRKEASNLVARVKQGELTLADIYGGYGKPINPYGLTMEESREIARQVQAKGGYRKTRHAKRSKQGTRKRKDPLARYAEQFSALWKVHAKNKKTR